MYLSETAAAYESVPVQQPDIRAEPDAQNLSDFAYLHSLPVRDSDKRGIVMPHLVVHARKLLLYNPAAIYPILPIISINFNCIFYNSLFPSHAV